MTSKVIPSDGRLATHQTESAKARWASTDWIVPGNVDLNATNESLSGAPLNAASISTSGLDVSIDTFEAWVGGAWVGSDDSTVSEHTHTLAGNSTTTTLYLGYDHSATDTFIFGPSGDFASADPKIPVVDATDDGSSVTDTDDRRPVGLTARRGILLDSTYDDTATKLGLDTGTLAEPYDQYEVVIYREAQTSNENYLDIRVNGASTQHYSWDLHTAFDASGNSVNDKTEWSDIAGVHSSDNTTDWALHVLRITCPREIVATGNHHPIITSQERTIEEDVDVLLRGQFAVDQSTVDQINIFGGENSTGFIEIYGRALGHGTEAWY